MSTARVKKPKPKRRSKAAIALARAEKEARRLAWKAGEPAREAKRIARLAEQWAEIRRAVRAHARARFSARTMQEAGVQWLMGYETPAAKLFASYVAQEEAANAEALRQRQIAGDPLNITGHTPVISEKNQRKLDEKARLARGERKIVIPDPDSPNQNVMVSTFAHSLRRVKLKIHQEHGAEKFLADYEAAQYSGLSSVGFDPRVDASSKQNDGYVRAAEAQKRLNMAKAHIGERNYDVVVGVLILNINATKAHAAGARQHSVVQNDIDVAMNALSGFYDPARLERDPTWKAFKKIIEAGLSVIRQGEEEVR